MLVTQPNVTSVAGYSVDNGMFAALLDNRQATKGLPHDWMTGVRRNILAGYVLRCSMLGTQRELSSVALYMTRNGMFAA